MSSSCGSIRLSVELTGDKEKTRKEAISIEISYVQHAIMHKKKDFLEV